MRLLPSSRRSRRRAVVGITVLSVVGVVAAFVFWPHDDVGTPLDTGMGPHSAVGPGAAASSTGSGAAGATGAAGALGANGSAGDIFGPTSVTSNTASGPQVHNVLFRATSDGTLGPVAYRVRGGRTQTMKSAGSPLNIRRSVKGPRPVAQMAVQVAPGASFARCSIYVDGKLLSTFVARGPNSVVVCTA